MENIYPCPFCGKLPSVLEFELDFLHADVEVKCMNAVCPANPRVIGSTREKAIEMWNTRGGEKPGTCCREEE